MATSRQPAVPVPESVITMGATLELARSRHADHPQPGLTPSLIENTGVRTRHLVQPVEETLAHPGFEERNRLYAAEAKARVPMVVRRALEDAGLRAADIDLIIHVSCTGFMMPPLTAWPSNTMGFPSATGQSPIAQLGCAGGGAAINRAHDLCKAYPAANALIMACELCSLCYQPTDVSVGSLLDNGLFGDGVAATVVRGTGGAAIHLERNASYLVPDTEDEIAYAVRATGFHFLLDERVPGTMESLAPALRALAGRTRLGRLRPRLLPRARWGPRILDDLSQVLGVPPEALRFSRAALTEYGNVASVVVPDALRCLSDEGGAVDQARGLLAGSGPGSTAAQQVTFKVTGEQSRTASSCEVVVAPGFDIGAHVHTRGEELRYVREGEADVLAFQPRVRTPDGWRGWRSTQGDRMVRATPGTVSEVPPGCPYAFAHPTEGPARMFFHASPPPDREPYFEELMDVLSADGPADHTATAAPRRRSGIEQLTPLRHDRPARSH
ncbi:cupin domain-containing protein [Streptomyces sp. NPDC054835]|uniref:cupin domain-containing protein n=1 Tax=Streptomyces sp. NBC_01268 TaxID=2903806 RepID=UPI003FCE5A42